MAVAFTVAAGIGGHRVPCEMSVLIEFIPEVLGCLLVSTD